MKVNLKNIFFYIVIFIYIIIFQLFSHLNTSLFNLVTPFFWFILFLLALFIYKGDNIRIKYKTVKLQTIFIVVVIYYMIYFITGLFIGYSKNIYNTTFIGIIKNLWIYIIPIFFTEYIRTELVCNKKNYFSYLLIFILFLFININLRSIFILDTNEDVFKYAATTLIPTITDTLLLIYLSKSAGYYGSLLYIIPKTITTIVLPILPDMDWYYTSLSRLLLPLFVFIFYKNVDTKINSQESKKVLRHNNSYKYIPVIIIVLLITSFVAGLFKYKPTAILSDSMKPIYSRGDVVITEKVNKKNINSIKKYDIIEYILDNTIVAHRVINIEKHNDGTKLYTTMGDNNNAPDSKKVEEKQIIGKVKASIPKVGYPSVYLSELLKKKNKAKVETGKKTKE